MHFKIPLLALALATAVTASPISSLHGVNNACYYRRDIDTYVRRDASNSEVVCGKVKQQIQQSEAKRSNEAATNAEVAFKKGAAVNAGQLTVDKRGVAATNAEVAFKNGAAVNAEHLTADLDARSHPVYATTNAAKVDRRAYYEVAATNAKVASLKERNWNVAAVNAGELTADLVEHEHHHHERSNVAATNAKVAATNAKVASRSGYKI